MGVLKRIGIVIVQTIGALPGGAIVLLLIDTVADAFIPSDPEPELCEYLCFEIGWLPALIIFGAAMTASIWLIGRLLGQWGRWWSPILGIVLGIGVVVFISLSQAWLDSNSEIGFVVSILIIPLLAAIAYQWSDSVIQRQPPN